MHSVATTGSRSDSKRIKLENPLMSLLHSIQTKDAPHVRSYHLQTLLFFIDRHWGMVHDSLKMDVMNVLLQFVSYEDASIQSWIFLSFAAIAYVERWDDGKGPSKAALLKNTSTWDPIWTHSIRRANIPGICRAACHTGYTLLVSLQSYPSASHALISYQRVLVEIESWMKDLDVQGPSSPFDSICNFCTQCLRIASQDVRLYRMHLEDKVLSWLIDNWKIAGNREKIASHAVTDILKLLETLCGLPKKAVLTERIVLPQSEIVKSVMEEKKVDVIRDYLLHARLPPFRKDTDVTPEPTQSTTPAVTTQEKIQAIAPRGRERKISAFFVRTLESLSSEWSFLQEQNPTCEAVRRSMDFTFAAVLFESLLAFNGTTMNKQIFVEAGKVMAILAPLLDDRRLVMTEKAIVVQALEILVFDPNPSVDNAFHEALVQPTAYSGIKGQLLGKSTNKLRSDQHTNNPQVHFLRQVWQNPDVSLPYTIIEVV